MFSSVLRLYPLDGSNDLPPLPSANQKTSPGIVNGGWGGGIAPHQESLCVGTKRTIISDFIREIYKPDDNGTTPSKCQGCV
jgi:hypothetical protein